MMDYSTPARYPRSFRTRSEYLWIALLLSLLLSVTARAQQPIPPLTVPTSCSYVGIPATITLTSVDIPLGFSTRYLLVDMTTGLIVSTNPLLPVFTSIDAGLYYAVAAHYTGTLTNAVAGRLITEVYESTGCLTYGPTTGIKVCQSPGACDFASAPANLTFTAANVSADATTTYVLVDEATNLITQTSSTPSFSNVPIGDYAITAITYTSPLIGFAPGNSLYDVTTNYANCSAVSQAIHVRVCNSPITITSPANGATLALFNPPVTGVATPGSNVTILGPNNQVCSTTALPITGLYTCTSLTFVNGPASITAISSDNSTATSSFNVVVVPTVTILTPLNGTIAASFNPLITGTATPGSSVTIAGPNGQVCTTTATLAGLYSCASLTFVNGPASITAVAADNGVLSNTATSSFNVVVVPTVTILTPLNGTIAADFNPLITGTATPGSSVTITGPNGQVCTTTATLAGLYSCASLTFVNGPASITAVAADNGVLSNTATSSFIIAVIPTVVFTGPAPGSQTTLTPVIEGLATPGSSVTLTDGTAVLCITTADPLTGIFSCPVTLASPGSKTLSAATSIDGLVSLTVTLNFTAISVGGGLTLQAKVLLQGALINSPGSPLMRDDLRVGNYLPLLTPYASLVSPRFAQVGGGGELTTPLVLLANAGTPDAIVDWVLVELRDAANPQTIVATRSALVQRDGDVVVADNGTAPLSFTGLTGSSFYVSIKHRNHLGVMTAAAIPLSTTGTVVDFTTLSATATFDKSTTAISYDGLEMATINGKKALWAGNANHDDRVKYTGLQNDNTAILDDVINAQLLPPPAYNYDLAFGYFFGDLDMDGKVKYQGQTIDPNVIFNNVLSLFLPNATDGQLYNYDLFIEQLP